MAKVKKKIMKKNLFVAAAMMVAMTACVKEADVNVDVEENVPQTEEKVWVEFTAGVATKAELQEGVGEHQIVWEEDDEISINGYTFQVKEIKEEGLKATIGAFVPADFSAPYRAVYPASAGTSFDELIVNDTPAVVAGGFDDIVSVAYSDDTSLQFKHVTSLFKFQVPAGLAVNTVTISADEALAGKVSVEMADEESTPAITVKNAVKEVTLTGTFTPGQNYYVAVLPGTKTNLTVSFDGVVSKKWANPVEIEYGMIANMGTLPYARVSRNLEFSETTASATYGEDFTEPTLEGVKDGVEYTSSNIAVATVNATTGEVTLKGPGETTITATAPETSAYYEDETTYVLNVKQYVYLVPNVSWHEDDAWFAAYFYGNGEKWVEMTADASNSNIYRCEVPVGFKQVIFCRMNSEDTDINKGWDIKWNQTNDLNIPTDDKMYYYIEGWDNSESSKWDSKDFCETYFNANGKLYLAPSGAWKQYNERYAAYFFQSGKSDQWISLTPTAGCSYFNGAYEVTPPSGYTNIIFCRMDGGKQDNIWENKWDQTGDLKVSGGVLYYAPAMEWGNI